MREEQTWVVTFDALSRYGLSKSLHVVADTAETAARRGKQIAVDTPIKVERAGVVWVEDDDD